jgi:exosome complex component RRP43
MSSLTNANGSSLIRIGDTAIVCGVRAELLPVAEIANYRITKTDDVSFNDEDYTEIIANNLLVPNIELSTGCSPNHLPGGPPSVEAQSLSQRLLGLLHTSRLVGKEDLKIYYTLPVDADEEERAKGPQLKAYWTLYIDILCISYGGNVFDAAWLALYAALRDAALPKAWWDVDLKQILCSAEVSEAKKLRLQGMPVPLSWSIFVPEVRTGKKAGQEEVWVLCDPDAFEEECCLEAGCVVVDVDSQGRTEILKLEKNGGGRIGGQELTSLFGLAEKRGKQWQQILKDG